MRKTLAVAGAVLVLAACNVTTPDSRAGDYTKPPLDEPGLTITREQPTKMSELGKTLLPNPQANPVVYDSAGKIVK